MHKFNNSIITVGKLVQEPSLTIPAYQRPYKWTQENLNALLGDLRLYRDKSAYRLGTIVFHFNVEKLDIVDGQQRTLTLLLLVKAIMDERLEGLIREDIKTQLKGLESSVNGFLAKTQFSSEVSHHNLHQNFLAAKRATSRSDFTETDIDFLLNRCEVVTFVLTDVSEAFQFFDSQNARGRDLDPHDLLKAYHLREFSDSETHLKAHTASHWEKLESDTLAKLFANYLYRIRNWTQGKTAPYFNKAQVGVFKGVNLERVGSYPYVEPLRIAHHFVDDYNGQYQRQIDHQVMMFPFHLDQMVINGRRFFEMAAHYQQLITHIVDSERHDMKSRYLTVLDIKLDESATLIIKTLNDYSAMTRTGDKYVRTLFDCALIFYIDKFGTKGLSAAIEKLFIWAYTCRLRMQVVQMATMDNYALNNNVFELIKQATQPNDLLKWPLSTIKDSEVKGTKIDEIKELFRGLKYYE